MDVELSKKTTILLSPGLHARLTQLAEKRHTSLGELVRSACERQYGASGPTVEEKLAALKHMSKLNAPVTDVRTMKRQSVPTAEELLR